MAEPTVQRYGKFFLQHFSTLDLVSPSESAAAASATSIVTFKSNELPFGKHERRCAAPAQFAKTSNYLILKDAVSSAVIEETLMIIDVKDWNRRLRAAIDKAFPGKQLKVDENTICRVPRETC
jgi:hypothetical protein